MRKPKQKLKVEMLKCGKQITDFCLPIPESHFSISAFQFSVFAFGIVFWLELQLNPGRAPEFAHLPRVDCLDCNGLLAGART